MASYGIKRIAALAETKYQPHSQASTHTLRYGGTRPTGVSYLVGMVSYWILQLEWESCTIHRCLHEKPCPLGCIIASPHPPPLKFCSLSSQRLLVVSKRAANELLSTKNNTRYILFEGGGGGYSPFPPPLYGI